ncbi:DUF2637 domain-containing protein [Actinomadura sp. HBU206391]|uniref:DUF2637 domain-containing protein n=1 Tax=Actinomadura sp. HBU206391 TaxID=2731692 RepID=UPI00164FB949|nr:DUF2637 domain-containing protein [Actinomadura sp. HBU206391]MBC6462418.1 DUF2637 domain-containing protein [Actinomadura sp. HBU206391]
MSRRSLAAVADSGPVVILAAIAAAGSFTHIRDTATEHGQHGWMAWAVAVCIDLTCVMAARERQRDKRTDRPTARLSWPTVVLVGGILLSLAANLAQAQPTVWGWLSAATPAGAFLVAVSMLERRASNTRTRTGPAVSSSPVMAPPPSFGHPSPPSPSPEVSDGARPELAAAVPTDHTTQDGTPISAASPAPASSSSAGPAAALVEFAHRVATEHHTKHGRPITRDALRARLGVSNQLASDLLRQIRTDTT